MSPGGEGEGEVGEPYPTPQPLLASYSGPSWGSNHPKAVIAFALLCREKPQQGRAGGCSPRVALTLRLASWPRPFFAALTVD